MSDILTLTSDNLLNTIYNFLENDRYLENKSIEISDELKKLSIKYTGAIYNSNMPIRAMRSFIELQDTIYRIFSLYAYGEKKRLSLEMRHELEMDVIVKEGSSIYDIDIEKIIEAFSDRIRKMTGKELAGVTAAICITILASTLGSKAINHKVELNKLDQMKNMITDVQKNTVNAMIDALNTQQSFYRIISKQDFDKLEINGQSFTQDELAELVKTEKQRHPIENRIYSGKFRITDIHLGDDTIFLDVIRSSDKMAIRYVNLLGEIITTNDYKWFKDFSSGLEVEMTIVAREKMGKF
jgi:ASC-1-like (ASCH) protein